MTNVNKRTIKWNNGKTYQYFFSYSGAFNCSVIISFITRKNNNVSTPFKNLKKLTYLNGMNGTLFALYHGYVKIKTFT